MKHNPKQAFSWLLWGVAALLVILFAKRVWAAISAIITKLAPDGTGIEGGVSSNTSEWKQPEGVYQAKANQLHGLLSSFLAPKVGDVLTVTMGLNGEEQRAVYNAFGQRSVLPLMPKKNLLEWFQNRYDGDDYARVRGHWSLSGLTSVKTA